MNNDQSFGFVTKLHDRILWIEMNPDSHLPPPPFGTFIECITDDEKLIGIVYHARIKNIELRPEDPEQSPAVLFHDTKQTRVRLLSELQAVLIGSTQAGSEYFRQHYYNNSLFHEPVYALDEAHLGRFSINFSYFGTLLNMRQLLPIEDLLLTHIRKFFGFYTDKEKYSDFVYRELNLLFNHDHHMINRIIDRSGIHVKIRN